MEFVLKNEASNMCEEKVECPKLSLPNIGDTMKIIVTDWGCEVLQNPSQIRSEQNVIEVEVKSIKKAKLVLE